MDRKKVSIIVPVYNIIEYLSGCIDSILTQDYRDFELLLVDDGSTDGSAAVCDGYAKIDSRIKVLHKPNGGSGDARNQGLEMCTGDCVLFVDGDDFIEEHTLGRLVDVMEQKNADCVMFGMNLVSETGELLSASLEFEPYTVSGKEEKEKLLAAIYEDKHQSFPFSSCTKLFRREILKDANFPCGKSYEDNYFLFTWFDLCQVITVLPDRLYNYVNRKGERNTRKRKFDSRILDIIDASEKNYERTVKEYPGAKDWAKYNLVYAHQQALVAILKCEDWEEQIPTLEKLQKEMRKNLRFFVYMGGTARKIISYLLLCMDYRLYLKVKNHFL